MSAAKDLVFMRNYEILQSLCSLRMTVENTFAEVIKWYKAVSPYYRSNDFGGSLGGSLLPQFTKTQYTEFQPLLRNQITRFAIEPANSCLTKDPK
jgi:hypothetical protein